MVKFFTVVVGLLSNKILKLKETGFLLFVKISVVVFGLARKLMMLTVRKSIGGVALARPEINFRANSENRLKTDCKTNKLSLVLQSTERGLSL
ncbi:MAG: hypothetical protein HC849_23125 [Oscillatoriales cyanobacterium RU_3_3]|nr:hypothetical protein [Microcoleus sp. SU_5_3]NJL68636.1 hypothetical protein [Microcoleus sp. SM1_3_4]NJM62431.1 hypothetical protein [Oscillatoriales cyanobacterium RU_3_3]